MNKKLFLVLKILTVAFLASAQSPEKVKEPEYDGVWFTLDSKSGELLPLERQISKVKVRTKALGFAGGEALVEINGERSSKRFPVGEQLTFVVRVASRKEDPQQALEFFKFQSVKGMRQYVVQKVASFGVSSKDVKDSGAIAFDAVKYGDSSFKISSSSALAPGEYVLSFKGVATVFCFGIDPLEKAPASEPPKDKGSGKPSKK